MGKSGKRTGRLNHAERRGRVDQHGIGDGPRTSEQRSVCGDQRHNSSGVATGIGHHADPPIARGDDDGLSQRVCDIRSLDAQRLRIYRRAPSEIRRSFDASEINAIINDPDVFAFVTVPGLDRIDATELVADPRNVLIMAEGGGVLFLWQEPGIYEVHTNFLKAHRGLHALGVSLAAYRWMFTHTDCMTLLTRVPAFNKAADRFCAIVGATKEFERKAVWPTKNGPVDMAFWSLRYDDWIKQTPDLIASGRAFHDRLDAEFARHGVERQNAHADEDCHDLHAGAAAEMIYGGQPEKAVILYNRWARFAGYGLIALIARNPLVVDIGDAILQVLDGQTFKAIKCR